MSILIIFSVIAAPGLATVAKARLTDSHTLALAALRGAASAAIATTRYVDDSHVGGTQNGLNWSTSYRYLQNAISDAASGDTIRVAQGIYHADDTNLNPNTGDRTKYFQLKQGVIIEGGYIGFSDPSPNTRDFNRYLSILSGDLNDNDGPDFANNGENSFTLVFAKQVSASAVLDGFTITGGNGGPGAGISLGVGASPTIQNCRVAGNISGSDGGGMWVAGSSAPQILDSTIESNQAVNGGGVFFFSSNSPTFPQLKRCRFVNNAATGSAGALRFGLSGQTGNVGKLSVENCIFVGNQAHSGPGGAVWFNFLSRCEFINSVFSRNVANGNGGAFWCGNMVSGDLSEATLINCTFSNDTALFAGLGGGLRVESQASVIIKNGLFFGCSGADVNLQDKQFSHAGALTVTYSSVDGCSGSPCLGSTTNDAVDPTFVSAATDNLRLRAGSASINNGDPSANGGNTSTNDPDGHARVLPSGGRIDRGAYEYLFVDCNLNGRSDNEDINCGGVNNCGGIAGSYDCDINGVPDDCQTDCNHNGRVDSCDIASGISRDCNGDGVPDECLAGSFRDCNGNCINDACDLSCSAPGCSGVAGCGLSQDCNGNGILDECEAASKKFTLNAEFDQGVLINVYHGATGQGADRLQRFGAVQTKPPPYIWVAASGRNTIVRIDTATGTVLGEYASAPNKHVSSSGGTLSVFGNPSRTTVDLDGSVWVANRDDNSQDGAPVGSIVKIGLVIGGTRTGQYLTPPFTYCNCEDRDGDGLICASIKLAYALV